MSRKVTDQILARKTFTTGQIAAICDVAPRTVSKWFDAGTLKGYRIPGSNDRRIFLPDLVSFMRDTGIPDSYGLENKLCYYIATFGVDSRDVGNLRALMSTLILRKVEFFSTLSAFQLGIQVELKQPKIIILDFSYSRSYCMDIAKSIHEEFSMGKLSQRPYLIAIPNEDERDWEEISRWFKETHVKPLNTTKLAESIVKQIGRNHA